MSELKACPFCGKLATDSEKAGIKSDLEGWGWVGCEPCRVHIDYMNGDRGKQLAVKAWNRRAERGVDGGGVV